MQDVAAVKHRKLFSLVAIPGVSASVYLAIVGAAVFQNSFTDVLDIGVYYRSSDWIVGKGTLYKDVFSEYPLLANVLFAAVRLVSVQFGDSLSSFYFAWVSFATICFVVTAYACIKQTAYSRLMDNINILAWALPSTMFFAVLRYDVYPCLTTLVMMLSLRDERYYAAAIWIGLTIALKGYAIFLLPAFCFYLYKNTGIGFTLKAALVSVSPFFASLAAVAAFAGFDAMLAPFRFHAARDLNLDSTFQILNLFAAHRLHAADLFPLPIGLQLFFSLYPVLRRPGSFDKLTAAFGTTLLGLVTFSVFYSPQFLLWTLPVLSFSPHLRTRVLLLIYSVVTGGYFLVMANPNERALAVLVVCLFLAKAALLASCIKDLGADPQGQSVEREIRPSP